MSKMNRLLAQLLQPSDSLPAMPRMHPFNFLLQLQPVVPQVRRTADRIGPLGEATEQALVAYLMGMGFDNKTAQAIVAAREKGEAPKEDGMQE